VGAGAGVSVSVSAVADADAVSVAVAAAVAAAVAVAVAQAGTSTNDAKERGADLVELCKHHCVDALDVSECDGDVEASARLSR
jgi:hypothetical protein